MSGTDEATLDLERLAAIDPSARDLGPRPRPEALEFLLTRRSTPAKTLRAPGPDDAALALILRAGVRAPDHGKLTPWRLLLIREAAQEALARAAIARAAELGRPESDGEKAARSFRDGALIVAVIASPKASEKIPEIEQLMSAACVCFGLVNAALAAGFGANWLSDWPSHDPVFRARALGLAPHETVAGFIHIGAPSAAPPERPRPDPAAHISEHDPASVEAGSAR